MSRALRLARQSKAATRSVRVFPSTGLAAYNTAVIQAALNAGGVLEIIGSGIAYVNAQLVIGSNTKLRSDPRLTIRAVGTLNANLFVNACFLRGWNTVTLAWTSGLTATLTQTGHGYLAGDAVWVRGTAGTTDSAFTGVFTVRSVPNADTAVLTLRRLPAAAPVGVIQAKRADVNISVDVKWNGNYSGGNCGPYFAAHTVLLAGIRSLQLTGQGADSCKFCFCLGAIAGGRIDNIDIGPTNSDGLKLYGPIFDTKVTNFRGEVWDDAISAQTQEVAPFAEYDFTGGGDLLGIEIDGVTTNLNANAPCSVSIYATRVGFAIDNTVLRRIAGQSPLVTGSPIQLKGVPGVAPSIGSITISDVEWSDGANPAIGVQMLNIDSLLIERIHGSIAGPAAFANAIVSIGNVGTINRITVRDPNVTFGGSTGRIVGTYGTGTINSIVAEGGYVSGSQASSNSVVQLGATMTVGKVAVRNMEVNLRQAVSNDVAGVVVELSGLRGSLIQGINSPKSCTVILGNNQITGAYNGMVRVYGSITVVVYSLGGNVLSGTSIPLFNSGATVSAFGDDLQLDVTALARVNGSYCFNTNAAAGTLGAAGRVTCQGTIAGSWKLLADTSKAF